jgi:hypothetical protein
MVHILPQTIYEMVVITNNWHMDRTRAIFDTIFNLPVKRLQSARCPSPAGITITYEAVEAGVNDDGILKARIEREQQSLQTFLKSTSKLWNSVEDLHYWIFTKHNAYASKRLVDSKSNDNGAVNNLALGTY